MTSGSYSQKYTTTSEGDYVFTYDNNYGNKVDNKNAWLFAEIGLLYSYEYPMFKNTGMPEKMRYTETTKNVETGNIINTSKESYNRLLEYAPSGYISTAIYGDEDMHNQSKTVFTYDK